MRIKAINVNYGVKNVQKQQQQRQQPSFNGIFMRVGTGNKTLMPNFYSMVAYIPFRNGNTNLVRNTYKTKPIWIFSESEITAEEGKAAYGFLFNKIKDMKAYEATKKLKDFVQSMSFNGEHNVMYIEKKDSGIPNKENWSELKLADITSKLDEYEKENGISKKNMSASKPVAQKTYTIEELWEMIHRNGVA